MADFPVTADDTVAIGSDSISAARSLPRYAVEPPTWTRTWSDDFSGDLSAYQDVDGQSIVGGELVGTVGMWSSMRRLDALSIPGHKLEVGFDFWVPAVSTGYSTSEHYYGYQVGVTNTYIYVDNWPNDQADGHWTLYAWNKYLTFLPEASTWYRVRAVLDRTIASAPALIKLWKVGDPEPDEWQVFITNAPVNTGASNTWLEMEGSGSLAAEPARMDNVYMSGAPGPAEEVVGEAARAFHRTFNVGGVGTMRFSRPFDIVGVPFVAAFRRPFNIIGSVVFTYSRPFDVAGDLVWQFHRVFHVVEAIASPSIGGNLGTGSTASTTSPGYTAGDTSIQVDDPTSIQVGSVIQVGPDARVVTEVSGDTVSFTQPLSTSGGAGSTVSILSSPIPYGTTHPLTTAFVSGLLIFDKAGSFLGNIPQGWFEIEDAPSRVISDAGSMRFRMARRDGNSPNPYLHLLFDDRLVLVMDQLGGEPWLGSMTVQDWGEGQVQVDVPDVMSLLDGPHITLSEAPSTQIPASAVYQKAIDLMNVQRSADNEIVWGTDIDTDAPFFGEVSLTGSPLDVLDNIARRSVTEFTWRAGYSGGKATVTLVVRESFTAAGFSIVDGPDGNVAARPRLLVDPGPIVNAIRVRGRASSLTSRNAQCSTSGSIDCLDWMADASDGISDPTQLIPEGYASIDPGPRRRREEMTIELDWGLPTPDQQSHANDITAQATALFHSYLRAFHDRYGRPFYGTDGWQYDGPPSNLERFLNTGLGWRTSLRLVEYLGEPASMVMKSNTQQQALIVVYNIQTGEKVVRRVWFTETGGTINATLMEVHGKTNVYTVIGGVITKIHAARFDHSAALVGPPINYMFPNNPDGVKTSEYRSTLASASAAGATSISVTNATGFLAGAKVSVGEPGGANSETRTISSKSGNTLRLSSALSKPHSSGVNVVQQITTGSTTTYKTLRRVVSLSEDGNMSEALYFDSDQPVGPTSGIYYDPPFNTQPIYTRDPVGAPPYKRFSIVQLGSSDPRIAHVDVGVASEDFIGKVYDFEARSICDWDPRRDGIGAKLTKTTVVNNQLSTAPRWHFIPWGDGTGSTEISVGISATETKIHVANAFVLPQTYPYTATLGSGLMAEDVTVTAAEGTLLTVQRGANGTTAIVHAAGTTFAKAAECDTEPDQPDDTTQTVPWPDGQAWAERMLAKLSKPARRLTVQVVNANNEWTKVTNGSIVDVNIQSEGPEGGIVGAWRVLGWAPNYHAGTMELLTEEVL